MKIFVTIFSMMLISSAFSEERFRCYQERGNNSGVTLRYVDSYELFVETSFQQKSDCIRSLLNIRAGYICTPTINNKFNITNIITKQNMLHAPINSMTECTLSIRGARKGMLCAPVIDQTDLYTIFDLETGSTTLDVDFNKMLDCSRSVTRSRNGLICLPSKQINGEFDIKDIDTGRLMSQKTYTSFTECVFDLLRK